MNYTSPSSYPSKKARLDTFYLFFSLPKEMSFYILSFLSAKDVCSVSLTSRNLQAFSKENMLWRKLCKKEGWVVPRSIMIEATNFFDFKQYYSEKHALSQEGSLSWLERIGTSGSAPSKRFKHTSTVVGKYLIFIGGQETDTKRFNDIIYYDTETKTFTQPTIRGDKVPNFSRHSASLVGNRIFAFGGFDGHGTNFNLSVFDPYARMWTNVPQSSLRGTLPVSRTNHASASVGKKMYIFGGNNNNEAGAYQVLDDLSVLDTETMTWSRPPTTGDIPTARSGHTLTAIGKKLYLFGGGVWNETDGWVHKYNDLYILDTEAMHWSRPVCTGKVESSTFPLSFSVGRYLFIFGGGSKPNQCVTNDLYIFDTSSYHWGTPNCEQNRPLPRDMGTACVVGRNVYLVGGYAGGAVDYFDTLNISCDPILV